MERETEVSRSISYLHPATRKIKGFRKIGENVERLTQLKNNKYGLNLIFPYGYIVYSYNVVRVGGNERIGPL